jgi:hypothetical protein
MAKPTQVLHLEPSVELTFKGMMVSVELYCTSSKMSAGNRLILLKKRIVEHFSQIRNGDH